MSSQAKKQPARMRVQLPADLKPTYTNFALITNSPSEIVIDFAQIMPQVPQARVCARIVMTPYNTKLLLRALREHLGRYEAQYGDIIIPECTSLANQLFRPASPEDPPKE